MNDNDIGDNVVCFDSKKKQMAEDRFKELCDKNRIQKAEMFGGMISSEEDEFECIDFDAFLNRINILETEKKLLVQAVMHEQIERKTLSKKVDILEKSINNYQESLNKCMDVMKQVLEHYGK